MVDETVNIETGVEEWFQDDDADWLRQHLSGRIGERLRRHASTEDLVQETFVRLMRGPHVRSRDRGHRRRFLARIAANIMDDLVRYDRAAKRRPVHDWVSDGIRGPIDLDQIAGPLDDPTRVADGREMACRVWTAVALLDHEGRELVVMRHFEQRPWSEIAAALDVTEDAARMRFRRALGRMTDLVGRGVGDAGRAER